MNDRELLERAAKAAGYAFDYEDTGDMWIVGGHDGHPLVWNPLAEDGDAFRLAVKMRMNVDVSHWEEPPVVVVWCRGSDFEERAADVVAATRRAIVRAAAAMGDQ